MFRAHLSIQDVSRTAVRVASVERDSTDADVRILETIQSRFDVLNGELQHVVIFEAPTLASGLSDANGSCSLDVPLSADTGGACTVYTAAQINDIVNNGATPSVDGFDPADRVALSNVGIYIEYEYQYVTGFFDTRTITSTSVEVVELDL